MLQAWALEQEETSKRNFEEQDVLVPWRLQVCFIYFTFRLPLIGFLEAF